METTQKQLVDIRCPRKRKDKFTNQLKTCSSLCARVYPGSAGEAHCHKCKFQFEYSVDSQYRSETHVQAKPVQ